MSIIDEALDIQSQRYKQYSVGKGLRALDQAEREEFQQVINNSAIFHTVIMELFARRGTKVTDKAVRHHRNKVCECGNVNA